jgi:hypothetical protein
MGFIMGAENHTPAKPALKRAFIPGFSPVHLAVSKT